MTEKTANRKSGYYWVKTKEYNNWHIAHWNTSGSYSWTVCWHKFSMYDEDFLEIDENKINRKEIEVEVES